MGAPLLHPGAGRSRFIYSTSRPVVTGCLLSSDPQSSASNIPLTSSAGMFKEPCPAERFAALLATRRPHSPSSRRGGSGWAGLTRWEGKTRSEVEGRGYLLGCIVVMRASLVAACASSRPPILSHPILRCLPKLPSFSRAAGSSFRPAHTCTYLYRTVRALLLFPVMCIQLRLSETFPPRSPSEHQVQYPKIPQPNQVARSGQAIPCIRFFVQWILDK